MLRLLECLILIVLTLPTVHAQQEIIWQEDLMLTAQDFQAPPDAQSPHAAATYSGVRYAYDYSTNPLNLRFEVTAYFVPERSWIKYPDSRALLEHEQLHFDISELHARKLRKAFATTHFSSDFQRRIKEIYAENNRARRDMQASYDRETDHARIESAQQRWRAFVRDELARLEDYAALTVPVR